MTGIHSKRRAVLVVGLAVLATVVGSLALGGTVSAQDETNETITVDATVQDNGTVLADGTTTADVNNTTVSTEVIEGPSVTDFEVATTENISSDGQWNTTLNASASSEAGTYVLEASTGSVNATTEFQVADDNATANETATEVASGNETETETGGANETETGGANETATGGANDTATETETVTDEETEETDDNGTAETEGEDGPGFGVAVAVLGVVVAAFLAGRR